METAETRAKLANAIRDLQAKGDTATIDKLVSAYKAKYKTPEKPVDNRDTFTKVTDTVNSIFPGGELGKATGRSFYALGQFAKAGYKGIKGDKVAAKQALNNALEAGAENNANYGRVAGDVGQIVTTALPASKIPGASKLVNYGADVALGYASDVAANAAKGKKGGEVFTPGFGTAFNAGAPALGAAYKGAKNLVKPTDEMVGNAVNSLENTYREIATGTKAGKKRLDKAGVITELKNKAGTEGKTPERTLAELGVVPKRSGTKLDTFEQAAQVRENTAPLREANQAVLKEVELHTQPINLAQAEEEAVKRVRTTRNIDSGEAGSLEREIRQEFASLKKEYGETIPLSKADEIKSARWSKVPFDKKDITRPLLEDANYAIGKTFQKSIEDTARAAGFENVAQLNRHIGDIHDASKFLESLNGNTVKGGRIGKYTLRILGASTGSSLPAKIAGYIGGDIISELMMSTSISNPLKNHILQSIKKTKPEVYKQALQWLEDMEKMRGQQLSLPEGDPSKIAIPMGRGRTPEPNKFYNNFQQDTNILNNTLQLPPGQSSIITPNTGGTPNPLGRPYVPNEQGQVGGLRQRRPIGR